MKKILIPLALFLASCSQPTPNQSVQNTVNVTPVTADPGFNVGNFAKVLKTNSNPQDIERAINTPSTNVNNLDLNHDGQVDYLKVVESQSQNGVLTVVDPVSNSQSILIATVGVNHQNDVVNINSNQSYAGSNYSYTSHFTPTDYLLLAYFLHPHPYYVTRYTYGSYPSYYHHTIVHTYTSTSFRNNNSSISKSTSSTIVDRKSLSSPSQSQRSFAVRNTNTPIRTGGFGSKTSTTINSTTSVSHTRTSFGGGHSFGGRHR